MPSSTSSSEPPGSGSGAVSGTNGNGGPDASALMRPGMPGDDPRVVCGPVLRPLPERPLRRAALLALVVFAIVLAAWEWHWRSFGAAPGYRNSNGQWAEQRRRIDAGEGHATVLLGASRVLFDIDLDTWERVAGERPIQLAIEGTTPLPMLEDLADDPDFTGRLLVGVAPDVFFSGFAYRGEVLDHYRRQTPSQRIGDVLSMALLEPWIAFYGDEDFALFTVLRRQAWPIRPGVSNFIRVRKLSVSARDRNTRMWHKLETDAEYRGLARQIWAQYFDIPMPGMDTPELIEAAGDREIERTVAALARLRARGVPVLFVRPPSNDEYLAVEQRDFPRQKTWDRLLEKTAAPGIHFEDHPELQGLELPEWSHLSAADARRYTESLLRIIERDGAWQRAAP
jgi:hypothetical protein